MKNHLISLPKWNSARFDIPSDEALLNRLNSEMENSIDSTGRPSSFWMLPEELAEANMGGLMSAWCGPVGEIPLKDLAKVIHVSGSRELVPNMESFIRSIDHLGLVDNLTIQNLAEMNWCVMDLGSIMDFLLITAFCDLDCSKHCSNNNNTNFSPIKSNFLPLQFEQLTPSFNILEIGGGFGRLAEFLLNSHASNLKYVNIDAVPVSLMYSYLYLQKMFPSKKVCILTEITMNIDDFDILILPAWHLNKLSLSNFNLSINIESIQEMSQELANFYLGLLDTSTTENGFIYLVNAREYKFKGNWCLPNHWQCLLRHRTPRAWTINHPTEIFRKANADYSAQNKLRSAYFRHEISILREGSLW
jgi:hypothetical protein